MSSGTREQRQPRQRARALQTPTRSRSAAATVVVVGVLGRSRAPRASGGGTGSTASTSRRARTHADHGRSPSAAIAQLAQQPRLADARARRRSPAGGPARPRAARAASNARSSSLPTNERQLVGGPTCLRPGDARRARTPGPDRALPFTMNGSSSSVSNVDGERSSTRAVASTCPGSAFAITRAARFTASPITVYVRRYGGPMSPAKTRPALTPIRDRDARGVSHHARAARAASAPRRRRARWGARRRG